MTNQHKPHAKVKDVGVKVVKMGQYFWLNDEKYKLENKVNDGWQCRKTKGTKDTVVYSTYFLLAHRISPVFNQDYLDRKNAKHLRIWKSREAAKRGACLLSDIVKIRRK